MGKEEARKSEEQQLCWGQGFKTAVAEHMAGEGVEREGRLIGNPGNLRKSLLRP